jgi:protocatechuate 3,4-dioxygenase beta subunit
MSAAPIGMLFDEASADAHIATITNGTEPGQPLVVRGIIYAADGRTPASGVRVNVYHTDTDGYYTRPVSDPRRARLRGTLVTGADGRYELQTILPGHYPNANIERHIHVHLTPAGLPEHWVESFFFEGDPKLTPAQIEASRAAGAFHNIMQTKRDTSGVLQARRDFRIDPAVAERNRLVDGWYRDDAPES